MITETIGHRLDYRKIESLKREITNMSGQELGEMAELLARLDERTREFDKRQIEHSTKLEAMTRETNTKLDSMRNDFERKYVTIDQFSPVKTIVYGLVGTILVSVIGAVIALVVKSGGGK